MGTQTVLCKKCNAPLLIEPVKGTETHIICSTCNYQSVYSSVQTELEEIQFYGLNEPFSFASILKDKISLKKTYHVLEPLLRDDEANVLEFLRKKLLEHLTVSLDEINTDPHEFLRDEVNKILMDHEIQMDDLVHKKFMYYITRWFLGFDVIDPLMKDPHIEDISCDGAKTPVFVHHRDFGSLETNIIFKDEDSLSKFVVRIAQKCGKHISVANPMLDATMPDGSRIQMTLSGEITTKGSTFTIRRFKADPITPVDLIGYNTMSPMVLAYLWMVVQNGANALIAGGTASGKTSTLNAICLFIPRESKIVSIEETREINLPHPNWIPGVTRSGLGEVLNNQSIGEIDLYDLMKAALRQRPEYILVGEIRGKEAYVLFQAMATGHTTYSTVHADSMSSLIHRLEGKPINIPRLMLSSLNIVILQGIVKKKDSTVRRCKEIVEFITVDNETQEVLTNSVFKWDPHQDTFVYSGKSYLLERLREQLDLSHEEMKKEIENRESILKWLRTYDLREFTNVADVVALYTETPDEAMNQISQPPNKTEKDSRDSTLLTEPLHDEDTNSGLKIESSKKKGFFWITKKRKQKGEKIE
jgi:archaeal flagellar protein FlaI